jgi:hypothetical protein
VTNVVDIQPLMERAEQAAHQGDFAAAEEALNLAVDLQQRLLGASSPEVASTLNNLGIVYERLNRPADAESCYRRSFAIAKAAFGQDHPLVETSATNLREFCDARGIQFESPEPIPEPIAPAPRAATSLAGIPPLAPTPAASRVSEPAPLSSSRSARTPILLGVVAVAAIVAAVMFSSRRASPAAPSQEASSPAPAAAPSPSSAPVTASPATPVAATPTLPAPVKQAAPPPPQKPAASPAATAVTVEVLDARLCQSLDIAANWRCEPVGAAVASGPVFFVTRVKSSRDTKVEHRWYRDERLHQAVTLRVPGNGSSYRTYSRTTVSPDRAGHWRVELRDAGGTVLEQQTFVVGPP